jgi:hypothetical protein
MNLQHEAGISLQKTSLVATEVALAILAPVANCFTVGDPTAYQTVYDRDLPLGGVLSLPQKISSVTQQWRPIIADENSILGGLMVAYYA